MADQVCTCLAPPPKIRIRVPGPGSWRAGRTGGGVGMKIHSQLTGTPALPPPPPLPCRRRRRRHRGSRGREASGGGLQCSSIVTRAAPQGCGPAVGCAARQPGRAVLLPASAVAAAAHGALPVRHGCNIFRLSPPSPQLQGAGRGGGLRVEGRRGGGKLDRLAVQPELENTVGAQRVGSRPVRDAECRGHGLSFC
jgi:hypothetical protein